MDPEEKEKEKYLCEDCCLFTPHFDNCNSCKTYPDGSKSRWVPGEKTNKTVSCNPYQDWGADE